MSRYCDGCVFVTKDLKNCKSSRLGRCGYETTKWMRVIVGWSGLDYATLSRVEVRDGDCLQPD